MIIMAKEQLDSNTKNFDIAKFSNELFEKICEIDKKRFTKKPDIDDYDITTSEGVNAFTKAVKEYKERKNNTNRLFYSYEDFNKFEESFFNLKTKLKTSLDKELIESLKVKQKRYEEIIYNTKIIKRICDIISLSISYYISEEIIKDDINVNNIANKVYKSLMENNENQIIVKAYTNITCLFDNIYEYLFCNDKETKSNPKIVKPKNIEIIADKNIDNEKLNEAVGKILTELFS